MVGINIVWNEKVLYKYAYFNTHKGTASLHGMGGQYGVGYNVLLLFFEH